jgi:FtsH-binding integral membrane protein
MVSGRLGPIADTADEVDATFRTQRRVVLAYFAVFLLVTLAVPALTLVLDWWHEGRLVGGMSPAFVMTAAGLYVFFFLLAIAAASLQSTVEDRMLGADEEWEP